MNDKQKLCLFAGIVVLVLMLLYPPWLHNGYYHGYQFLWYTPALEGLFTIDWSRLIIQAVVTALVVAGCLLALNDGARKER